MKIRFQWQLDRIRAALRVIHRFDRDADGNPYGWRELWFIIASDWEDETGIILSYTDKHGGERLRQFVEGKKDRDDPKKRKFPRPKDEMVDAIVAYLLSTNSLTEDELEAHEVSTQAPLRLVEYLYGGSPPNLSVSLDWFSDSFTCTTVLKVSTSQKVFPFRYVSIVRSVSLQPPGDEGIVQAIERVEHYEYTKETDPLLAPDTGTLLSETVYAGWAVLVPENMLLMFLKNTNDQSNRYYLSASLMDKKGEASMSAKVLRLQKLDGSIFDAHLQVQDSLRESENIVEYFRELEWENIIFK